MHVEELAKWIKSCRLDGFRRSILEADKDDPGVRDMIESIRSLTPKALANTQMLAA